MKKIKQNMSASAKSNMLRFRIYFSVWLGMVKSNVASGYVAKIRALSLNFGAGMLRLSACMLNIGHGSQAIGDKERLAVFLFKVFWLGAW